MKPQDKRNQRRIRALARLVENRDSFVQHVDNYWPPISPKRKIEIEVHMDYEIEYLKKRII